MSDTKSRRQSRKLDHLKYAAELIDGPVANGFKDFRFVHNCLPDIDYGSIDLSTTVAGIKLAHPVIINAITGGAADVTGVNIKLAELARQTNSAMAVGSQFAAVETPAIENSYKIINKINPHGVIFANLGAHASVDNARYAVEMIGAQALQIHLNVAQEVFMTEGDRNLANYLDNIATIASKVRVPVIGKEVGFGIAREQAGQLVGTGIKAIDVGGAGGTNFIAIETARSQEKCWPEFFTWGIPTAISAVEVYSVLPKELDMIVSGGIRTPGEALKAFSLGGKAVGIAGPLVKLILKDGVPAAVDWLMNFLAGLKRFMLLLGTASIIKTRQVPLIITGYSREWLTARGFDPGQYANNRQG